MVPRGNERRNEKAYARNNELKINGIQGQHGKGSIRKISENSQERLKKHNLSQIKNDYRKR